jgi:hypothetical protein
MRSSYVSIYLLKQCFYIILFQASVTDLLLPSDCATSAKIGSGLRENDGPLFIVAMEEKLQAGNMHYY